MIYFTLIIPAYNVEKYIERCLTSCLRQDIPTDEYEIIVVNDGSKDNTLEIVKHIAEKHFIIQIIDKDNGGLSSARNAGLSKAQGEYVWFIDSDDWIRENCLSEVKSRLEKDDSDVLAMMASIFHGNREEPYVSFLQRGKLSGKESLKHFKDPGAPFYIFRRSFLEERQLYFTEGIYHEDSEFTPRALYEANWVSYLPVVLYYIYPNPNSITRSVNFKRIFDSILVCNMLEDYLNNNAANEDKYLFSRLIARNLNATYRDAINAPDDIQNKVSQTIYEHKGLLKHYFKAKTIRYFLIGIILVFSKRDTCSTMRRIMKDNN